MTTEPWTIEGEARRLCGCGGCQGLWEIVPHDCRAAGHRSGIIAGLKRAAQEAMDRAARLNSQHNENTDAGIQATLFAKFGALNSLAKNLLSMAGSDGVTPVPSPTWEDGVRRAAQVCAERAAENWRRYKDPHSRTRGFSELALAGDEAETCEREILALIGAVK